MTLVEQIAQGENVALEFKEVLYDNRLEVISPGGLVREMTVEDARNGFSKIRNHAIGAALAREVGLSRSGVERNLRQLKADGLLVRSGADNGGVCEVQRMVRQG